ncbi:MAG: DMT family transporter [Muribaculaceae bacterium]|nr:DMT family transporter [Muribaculaceae bacterium]
MNPKLKGNLYMLASKTFSGLNENALRYLLPTWMGALTGVVLRLGFGSLFFWVWGFFTRDKGEKASLRDKLILFGVGVIFVYGYMITLLEGLTYTTPISSSIFISLQPAFVYIICLCIRTDKLSAGRVAGILIGFGGALICVLTQKGSAVASDPLKGNMFCLASAVLFASYLVIEKRYLKRLSSATVSKWTFGGGAVAAAVVVCFTGWDARVLTEGLFSTPMLVLLFVLIFPTSVSYLLQDFGLKLLPATVVALYGDWILIVAAVVSYILGQDVFSWWQILAIVMMLASVYLVENAESKSSSAPA